MQKLPKYISHLSLYPEDEDSPCPEEYLWSSGDIFSSNYPNDYGSYTWECLLHIMAPSNSAVTITFHVFDVEYHDDCAYDAVEVIVYKSMPS